MQKETIPDYIFNWKELNKLFNINDEELGELDKKTSIANKKLHCFINQKVHPKIRRKLKKLIEDNENNLIQYCYREGQIYYNTGFTDGVQFILSILIS